MKYRKKPIVIDAIQWLGINTPSYAELIYKFPECFGSAIIINEKYDEIVVKTLEGNMTANKGDYIIRGVKGEFYPCKEEIFNLTYEKLG